FDGVIQLSDCGSQNGTLVNGSSVIGGVALQDRDVITLGGVFDLTVHIGTEREEVAPGSVQPHTYSAYQAPMAASYRAAAFKGTAQAQIPRTKSQNQSSGETWFSVPVIAGGAIVLILLVSGLLLVISKNAGSGRGRRQPVRVEN